MVSEIVLIALIAALPPTIAALATWRQGKIIHKLVNSQLTAVKAELVMAKDEIGKLQKFIMERDVVP